MPGGSGSLQRGPRLGAGDLQTGAYGEADRAPVSETLCEVEQERRRGGLRAFAKRWPGPACAS